MQCRSRGYGFGLLESTKLRLCSLHTAKRNPPLLVFNL
jgi:hypothetical protein